VRELEHWIESAIVLSPSGVIRASHLPVRRSPGERTERSGEGAGAGVPMGLALDEATRRYIAATVTACDGNKAEAARRLGIGRNTIARLLKGKG
jgi:Nif-specific regulatory protein